MSIRLRELTSASCQSMAHIAIYVNLYTRIRAVPPSTCKVVHKAFGHLIRAPHYFQTFGWIGFIYGLMIGTRKLEKMHKKIGEKFVDLPAIRRPMTEVSSS